MASYPLLSQSPTPVEVELGCDNCQNSIHYPLPDQLVRKYQVSLQLPSNHQCNHCVLQVFNNHIKLVTIITKYFSGPTPPATTGALALMVWAELIVDLRKHLGLVQTLV